MNKDALEQEPCDTCGYEEGSIYCKEHCPHEAKIEQEPREESEEVPCDDCKYLDGDGCRLVFEQIEYGKASDECPNDNNVSTKNTVSGDAISRKIILAFLSGLISDETERKKALQYINELPSVNPQPCEDAISREDALMCLTGEIKETDTIEIIIARFVRRIRKLPPVTPQPKTGRCKDCKWWKDSDGVYRRGDRAESKCPINRKEVLEGNGYCYMYEPQERSE